MAQSAVRRADEPDVMLGCNRRRFVLGAVVDDDDLESRVAELRGSLQTFANGATAVETADHDRKQWPVQNRREGCFAKGIPEGRQGKLGSSITTCNPEFPII